MADGASYFCTDDVRAWNALPGQPGQRLNVIFFKTLGVTADNSYGKSPSFFLFS